MAKRLLPQAQSAQLSTENVNAQNLVIGQIEIYQLSDASTVPMIVAAQQAAWIKQANDFLPSLVRRGGGLVAIEGRVLAADLAVIMLKLNSCEAMGANYVTQLAEHLRHPILSAIRQGAGAAISGQPEAQAGAAIVSNYATESLVTATLRCPMSRDDADKIMRLPQRWACRDVYRATTHNKGIFNAIDAILIATGNDTRVR